MTLVGKANLDHPALGTAGGSVLHASIENLWEKVSDHLPARWHLFESVANGDTVTYEHGFQVPFGDLRVHVYLKGASSNTKVEDPGADGWSIVATSGYAQSKLDVTAPSSGGPFDFYLYVSHEPMNDKLDLSGGTMTGTLVLSGDPTQDLHAATKRYVDALAQGLDPKASVKVATTANIGLSGTMTIDGVAVSVGDRVLVKDQTTASQNGIYLVGAGAWSRAADMDAWTEVPGAFVFVEEGTANADQGFVCTADQGGTIGTTAISWVKFTGIEQVAVDDVTIEKSTGVLKVKDGGIANAQISASAAIADSKLAKLTTAGKVSGDAITDGTIGGTTAITTTGTPTFNGTSHMKLPAGTDAQRPGTPANGMIRFNSSSLAYEGYNDGEWKSIGGGGTVSKVWSSTPSGTVYGNIARVDGLALAKADATTSANAEVLGIVTKVYGGGSYERDITLAGSVTNLTAANFSENALPARGDVIFLSTTPGLMSVSEPTTIGQVSVPLGVCTWSDTPGGWCTVNFAPKRGVVVGGANARTQVSLLNNVSNQLIQNMSGYEAGELTGWVYINAGTKYRFYVQAQFVKGGDGVYDVAYQTAGDTPPSGFLLSVSDAGELRYTMPNVASFSSASLNYALNAPAVGTNFPLSVGGSSVVGGTPTIDTINEYTSGNGVQFKGRTNNSLVSPGYVGELIGSQTNGTNGFILTTNSSLVPSASSSTLVSVVLNKGFYLCTVTTSSWGSTHQLYTGVNVGGTPVIGLRAVSAVNLSHDAVFSTSFPLVITADSTTLAVIGYYTGTVPTNALHRIGLIRIS